MGRDIDFGVLDHRLRIYLHTTYQWEILQLFQISVINIPRFPWINFSIWTVFISNHVIFEFFHLVGSLKNRLSIVSIIIIHFLLAGAGYLEIWRVNDGHYDVPLSNWKVLVPIWAVCMFIFVSLPPKTLVPNTTNRLPNSSGYTVSKSQNTEKNFFIFKSLL